MPKKRKPFSELSKEVRKRPGAAAEIDARKRAIVSAVRLSELREQIGKTQTELAQVLEMTQANVSRIEHSENLYLRTLADYVGALGGAHRGQRGLRRRRRTAWLGREGPRLSRGLRPDRCDAALPRQRDRVGDDERYRGSTYVSTGVLTASCDGDG